MSKIANIIIDVDEKKAVAGVNKLAHSFTKVDKNIQKSNEALGELGDQTKQLAKAYFGLEAVSKIFQIADAALTATAAQDGLTGATKDNAKAYVELKKNVQDVVTGMVLATANIASSIGSIFQINDLLSDTASAWREIAGLRQRSVEDMDEANAENLALIKVTALTQEYKKLSEEYDKYKNSNKEFANIAYTEMKKTETAIKEANEELGKYGKSLDDATIKALKNGETTSAAIRLGDWDIARKKQEELENKRKQAFQAELIRLERIAYEIKKNFGDEVAVIDRQYELEVSNAKDALKAKKITEAEYSDAIEKALQKRNKLFRDYEKRNEDIETEQDTPASEIAYQEALKEADIKNKQNAENLAKEKEYQDQLLTLKKSYATKDSEITALQIEERNRYYDELSKKYADDSDMQVEIAKARTSEIKKIEQDVYTSRINQINESTDRFLYALSVMAKEDKKYAKAYKALALAQAITNTAIGITKAYADGGVLGFITGASIAAAGAVQISEIKSQKFATGGIVEGSSYSGDNIPIYANSGEMILNKAQQQKLFNDINNGGSSQSVNIQFNIASGTNSVDLRKILAEQGNVFAAHVAKAIRDPKFKNVQASI